MYILWIFLELKDALYHLGPSARKEPIYQVLLDYDAEGKGLLTFEQFLHLFTSKLVKNDSRENVAEIFSLFDSEKRGFIDIIDLRRVNKNLNMDFSEEQLLDMI